MYTDQTISINMHFSSPNVLPFLLLLQLIPFNFAENPAPQSIFLPHPPPPPSSADAENVTLEYIDPTFPPFLPTQNPKCSLFLLQHDFADTVRAPLVSTTFSPPPDCPAPWSRIVLDLSASASDLQQDRVTAIWIDGAEILRSSTPFPMAPGVFWRVRKDITRYTALLRKPITGDDSSSNSVLSMILENSNETFPGVYSVNVSIHFYRGALHQEEKEQQEETVPKLAAHPIISGLYDKPADVILPISNAIGGSGFWFRVGNETDMPAAVTTTIPKNTYRAVMEIYSSNHGDDEYWYVNPLQSIDPDVPDPDADPNANGGFRQVVATIDGRYAGGAIPFPVICPGSINPYFWVPVTAIGAYDHPTYDLDLTPFVGELIDGRPHEFGLAVKDCLPYWLVSANLHLWLDEVSDEVEAKLVRYKVPPLWLDRQADWEKNEGRSEIEGQVIIRFAGWVSSSRGNISTNIRHKIKFRSHVELREKGMMKEVDMESKERTNIRIEKDGAVVGRVMVETDAPVQMEMILSTGSGGSELRRTKLVHGLAETVTVAAGKTASFRTIADRQESEGSALMLRGVAVWGSGDTKSVYKFRNDKSCYLRTVNAVGGKVTDDEDTASCSAVAVAGL